MVSPHQRPRRTPGFSLVEVTLAIGIVAVAATTIFALLPTALNTLKSSNEQTVEAQISEQLSSNLLQTPFADLPNATVYYFYDNEGTALSVGAANAAVAASSNASDAPARTVFTAQLSVSAASYPGSGSGAAAAAGSNTATLANSMKLITVKITTLESKNQPNRRQNVFGILIARRDALVSS